MKNNFTELLTTVALRNLHLKVAVHASCFCTWQHLLSLFSLEAFNKSKEQLPKSSKSSSFPSRNTRNFATHKLNFFILSRTHN